MRATFILAFVVFFITGCNGVSTPEPEPPTAISFKTSLATYDKFNQVSRTFLQQEEITMVLSLENLSNTSTSIRSSDARTFEISLKDSSGAIVWNRSDGLIWAPTETITAIPAHGTITETVKWSQILYVSKTPLPTGTYTLEGHFRGVDQMATLTLTII